MNGTPIFDIKPYLPYVDSHPDALNGFANSIKDYALHVTDPHEMLSYVPIEKRSAIIEILSQDPRPSYQEDPKRIYGLRFSDYEIKFRVEKNILYILSIQ